MELESLGRTGAFFQTDVSNEQAVESMIGAVMERFGRLDFVVNNAGCGSDNCGIDPDTAPSNRWEFFRSANLDSNYFVTSHAIPHLMKNSSSAVVNISSTATFHGNWGLYGVAKSGVDAMTRSFAAELAAYGIRVNAISPGWIETSPEAATVARGGDDADWEIPPSLFNRMGTPEEIANTAAFLVSNEASFITGQTLVVDGGLTILDYPSKAGLATVGHRLFSRSELERC